MFKGNLLVEELCKGRGTLQGKDFWVLNIWRPLIQKWLKQLNLKIGYIFITECWTKMYPRFFWQWFIHFLLQEFDEFLKRIMHGKYLKVDYSVNIWKEENRIHGFVCPLIGYISLQMNYCSL